jgi:hypothetical protein
MARISNIPQTVRGAVADPMLQAQPLPRLATNPASFDNRASVSQFDDVDRERARIIADCGDTLSR